MSDKNSEASDSNTLVKPKQKTKRPPMYKVILLNDDFTPMEFVILVLKKHFYKTSTEAEQIMLEVHNKGAGIAGVYPYEVAETKAYLVNEMAKTEQFPLKCIVEADSGPDGDND
ncbi:MAG: ATP-dependent Clp protease adapter ClpS [Bdellovibrionales bacterium]|nr:ATP-dependent Clp protease adapter ClpS [Bdellovibrionales bacterium]